MYSLSFRQRKITKQIYIYLLGVIIIVPVLFPLYFVLTSSLKNMADVYSVPPILFGFIPIFEHYIYIFESMNYAVYMYNSAIIAVTSSIFALFIGVPAAYVIARHKMAKVSACMLLVRLLPNISLLLPYYFIFSRLGLVDTHFGLSLAHSVGSVSTVVWIMTGFITEIPTELDEAAIVDGCSWQGVFAKIILPISVSGIVTCATLVFLNSWNNFQHALILGGKRTQTLPVTLQQFVSGSGVRWGRMLAGTVVVIIPTLILTMLLQKYIVKGLTAGAVKG